MDSFGRKILISRNRVCDTTKNKHLRAYQTGSMREPSFWKFTLCFDFLDPFHMLNIQSSDLIVVNFILEVRCAIVSTEKYQHHIVKYTSLLFFFWGKLAKNGGRSEPCADCSVESVIIFKYGVADSSKDNHFVAISGHTMKRSSGWQNLFHISIGKLMDINLNQRINKLSSGFSFHTPKVTSKDINLFPDGTHGMSLNFFVRKLTVSGDPFPFEASAGDIFLCWVRLFGTPSGWSFNPIRVSYDTIVLCSKLVDYCWVLLID